MHLYLLIGQSNMAGRGTVEDVDRTPDPRILVLTQALAWQPASEPLHFDKPGITGVGPGLAFARAMAQQTEVRIGLIPCAVGGTSIRAWEPGAADQATSTHPYDDMLVRARAALAAGVLTGIIWHQGEADRADASYGEKLTALVQRVRSDLAAPAVPFVAGELAAFRPEVEETTRGFNTRLNALVATIPHFAVITAAGTTDKGDQLHFDAASARLLGGRYAEAMRRLQS